MNLAKYINGNKKDFYRCSEEKKKTNADLLLNRERYMVTKNMESQKYSMPLFHHCSIRLSANEDP